MRGRGRGRGRGGRGRGGRGRSGGKYVICLINYWRSSKTTFQTESWVRTCLIRGSIYGPSLFFTIAQMTLSSSLNHAFVINFDVSNAYICRTEK